MSWVILSHVRNGLDSFLVILWQRSLIVPFHWGFIVLFSGNDFDEVDFQSLAELQQLLGLFVFYCVELRAHS